MHVFMWLYDNMIVRLYYLCDYTTTLLYPCCIIVVCNVGVLLHMLILNCYIVISCYHIVITLNDFILFQFLLG